MKTFLSIVLGAAVGGLALGSALGYIEARLPAASTPEPGKPDTKVARPQQGPVAEFPETTFNFDRIERGTSMKHAFKVRNVGDAPLTIEVLSTTCKCTVGDLADKSIPPGGETDVMLEWTAKTAPGPFRHGASIGTNDPAHSRTELVVEGEVVESTSLQPADMLFGTILTSQSKTASVYVMSNLDEKVEIIKHEFSDPKVAEHIKLEITPAEKSELPLPTALSGARVTATYSAGKSIGPFFTWLTFETNLKNASKLTVPVAGNVMGDISIFGTGWNAAQSMLRIGPVSGKVGKKVPLIVAVRGEHAQSTELEVASVDPPELKVSLGERKEMGAQLIHIPLTIEIPPGTRPMVHISRPNEEPDSGRGDGVVVLKSTHPDTSEVRLLVRFSVE